MIFFKFIAQKQISKVHYKALISKIICDRILKIYKTKIHSIKKNSIHFANELSNSFNYCSNFN
jgi:hypothetical protein